MDLEIRRYLESDTPQLAELFFNSVREGAAGHYSEEQRHAWAPSVPDTEKLRLRLEPIIVFVAEDRSGIVGFMTLDDTGYIDLAFVRPDRIGTGIGSLLYARVEQAAQSQDLPRLFTNASKLAKPFFEKHGWAVCKQQEVDHRGVMLTNFSMEKLLTK